MHGIGGIEGGVVAYQALVALEVVAQGANRACSSGTCPAGVHAAMPCCHTIVCAVSCPVGTNCFKVDNRRDHIADHQ